MDLFMDMGTVIFYGYARAIVFYTAKAKISPQKERFPRNCAGIFGDSMVWNIIVVKRVCAGIAIPIRPLLYGIPLCLTSGVVYIGEIFTTVKS